MAQRGKEYTVKGSETAKIVKSRSEKMMQEKEMELNDPSMRETQMTEHPITEYLRQLAEENSTVFHMGQRAFVSWVRAYNERKESGVFDTRRCSLGACATGMGLTKLPHLEEFSRKYVPFTPVHDESKERAKDKGTERVRRRDEEKEGLR